MYLTETRKSVARFIVGGAILMCNKNFLTLNNANKSGEKISYDVKKNFSYRQSQQSKQETVCSMEICH